MPIRLPLSKIAHPFPALEISNALTFPNIIIKIALIFVPVISLQAYEGKIRLVIHINHSYYAWVAIVFNAPSMEFTVFKLTLIMDFLLVPIEFTVAIHFSFFPLSDVILSITILVHTFPITVRFPF